MSIPVDQELKPERNLRQMDQYIGNLLITGLIISSTLILIGGGLYLVRHGADLPDYQIFRGEPANLRHVRDIVSCAAMFNERCIIQLGLLLLIATPIARVVMSAVQFIIQRDITYVAITLIVLAILIFSLAGGSLPL